MLRNFNYSLASVYSRSSALRATYKTFVFPEAATIIYSIYFPRSTAQKNNPKLTWFVKGCVVIIEIFIRRVHTMHFVRTTPLFCHMKRPPLRELKSWF
jgi:hypothetical protein